MTPSIRFFFGLFCSYFTNTHLVSVPNISMALWFHHLLYLSPSSSRYGCTGIDTKSRAVVTWNKQKFLGITTMWKPKNSVSEPHYWEQQRKWADSSIFHVNTQSVQNYSDPQHDLCPTCPMPKPENWGLERSQWPRVPDIITDRIRQELTSTDPWTRKSSSCLHVSSDCCRTKKQHPVPVAKGWQ